MKFVDDTCPSTGHATEVNRAGLAAQLGYLLDAWGPRRLQRKLEGLGGVLDAIVRKTSLTEEQLDQELGRSTITDTGDLR